MTSLHFPHTLNGENMKIKEEWKEIEDYPNYLISNYGRVFNSQRNRIVRGSLDRQGYIRVTLIQKNEYVSQAVHRIVAFAFVEGYFEGAVVRHKDGDESNNAAWNLEWVSNKDKTQRSIKMGLHPHSFCIVETGDMFMYVYSCARYIGGDPDSILKCLNGTQQTHKGYHFEYIQRGGK